VVQEDVNKTSLEVVSTAARPAVLRGSVSPPVGQWVKIAGRSGVFVVLRVDAEVGTADVLLLTAFGRSRAACSWDSCKRWVSSNGRT
jgi:hypothetical protein